MNLFDYESTTTALLDVHEKNREISYKQLRCLYLELDQQLRRCNVVLDNESLMAVCFPTGDPLEIICACLAADVQSILLPIDPSCTQMQVETILADAKPHVILFGASFFENETMPHPQLDGHQIRRIDFDKTHLYVALRDQNLKEYGFPLNSMRNRKDAMYIIYTSGSSGVPKGVCGTYTATLNRLKQINNLSPLSPQDRVLRHTRLAFVDSIREIYVTLMAGATLVLIREKSDTVGVNSLQVPPSHCALDIRAYFKTIRAARIYRIHMVPSYIEKACQALIRLPEITTCFLSGEPLAWSLVHRLFQSLLPSTAVVYNIYGTSRLRYSVDQPNDHQGCTEVAGDVSYYKITAADLTDQNREGFVPIGRSIAGNSLRLAETSELLVFGCQVALGYLNE